MSTCCNLPSFSKFKDTNTDRLVDVLLTPDQARQNGPRRRDFLIFQLIKKFKNEQLQDKVQNFLQTLKNKNFFSNST
ncbi:hypothetical protein EUGRSUZ_K02498 [Eucalyptus grandis]|uniref:Uncharacterized protein n=2 Tax=Eucalyptus grandis TaxID=71139 RepID=A0ACC3IYR8_EUCGR|nr:hypothetical protein EUGRSUZ_K02498 [Eucalyptus grandis]